MNDEPQNLPCDDVSWLALRYVSGEMAEAEIAVFEERLGVDEAACEAVSTAVQVSLAARIAFESSSSETIPCPEIDSQPVVAKWVAPHGPARSARWISLSVSVLALLLVLSITNFWVPGSTESVSSDAERARELAVLWTQASFTAEPHENEMLATVENENESISTELGEDRLSPVDLVAGVPEWMLVALETQRGKTDDGILEN